MTRISNILRHLRKVRQASVKEFKRHFRNYKRGTISSSLTRLVQREMIERVSRGIYQIIEQFFEHFISALLYCQGKKEVWYARSYREDMDSIEEELLQAIEDYNSDRCSDIRKRYGYQFSKSVPKIPRDGVQYPEADIGRLFGARRIKREIVAL